MKKDYACSLCGNRGIKLWRPYMDTEPLVCAKCAESRQSPMKYPEVTWKKTAGGYIGIHTGKKLPLEKWTVDDEGQVPSYKGPGSNGLPLLKTYQLIINLKDISEVYSSGETCMIPAILDKDGKFLGYSGVLEEYINWWKTLPTKTNDLEETTND